MIWLWMLLACSGTEPTETGEVEGPNVGALLTGANAIACEGTPPDHSRDLVVWLWDIDRAMRLALNVDGRVLEAQSSEEQIELVVSFGSDSGVAVLEQWAGEESTLCDGTDEYLFPESGMDSWTATGGGGTMAFSVSDQDDSSVRIDLEMDNIHFDGWSLDPFVVNAIDAERLP